MVLLLPTTFPDALLGGHTCMIRSYELFPFHLLFFVETMYRFYERVYFIPNQYTAFSTSAGITNG
jgi:hypothetical protein